DAIRGEMRLDFDGNPEPLAPVAKKLILEALGGMGAHIDDMEAWEASAGSGVIVFKGDLTERGTRQILSLMVSPSAAASEAQDSMGQSSAADPKVQASLRYYKSVKTLIDDLGKQKAKSYKNTMYFLNKYAKSIDDLPVLNVDAELLQYGAGV